MRRSTIAVRIKAVIIIERGDVELYRVTAEPCPVTNCSSAAPLSPYPSPFSSHPQSGL